MRDPEWMQQLMKSMVQSVGSRAFSKMARQISIGASPGGVEEEISPEVLKKVAELLRDFGLTVAEAPEPAALENHGAEGSP
mmetsp:Transcript_93478/g.250440  ORF Transcript_93478/g.250440 Transcript_93478/m.250440 type:complete len:81 (-) Transcript_93478:51-293(-)